LVYVTRIRGLGALPRFGAQKPRRDDNGGVDLTAAATDLRLDQDESKHCIAMNSFVTIMDSRSIHDNMSFMRDR
jgi:hypothetical protein